MKEIVIGISGASGVDYGIKLLEILSKTEIKTHLIITSSAKKIISIESDYTIKEIQELASVVHDEKDFTAPVASGSYRIHGMIIAPCSMKTLGSIANGVTDNLLTRVADVCLKERHKLVLVTRETPLNQIHLKNMLKADRAGACVLPACPGFYSRPQTIDEIIYTIAGRALDLAGIENSAYRRWGDQ
ncbi:3-octaprenyl-4-hydroxybenzoate carboxy-lyase [Methanosalsum zhilinae DSM 4017]|uniref:Flavin prenyltransferase UbiX n=1 Tax=Methanosalsum zhilinae (strain DSM 4017 / NBRC 107636 / OCM 62 / WeN5) TaxID=679901 RepID=F7XMD4_METZD|nr:UbiX family flavin prenyltransferase [Methanosalsum zhilinae]AEH61672.1 3-octaprenyl-4-hydroxybenzoate carboxy-lyase [Methanosalsum zhilinae DSM 4017]